MEKKNSVTSNTIENENPLLLEFYPFAYALYNENLSNFCWYCLDDQQSLKQCSGCAIAVFCNKECQTLAWKDHKFECKAFKASKFVPDIEVRLLGRIVVRYKTILNNKDKDDENFYKDRTSKRSIMDIWAHTDNISNDSYAMSKFNEIYESLIKFYDSKVLLSKDDIFQLHCRNFINRHAISDKAYTKEIGKGLYLDLCAYDHSCRPNTVYICNGFKAILKALNNQVNLLDRTTTFYSYIDLLYSKKERQKLLKDTWYFNCECDRCKDNEEHILTSINCPHCKTQPSQRLCIFGKQPYKDSETQIVTCPLCLATLSRVEVIEASNTMFFIENFLDKTNFQKMDRQNAIFLLKDLLTKFRLILPKVNIYYCKIIQALIPLISQNDYSQLLELHLLAEECVRICYPYNHPALGFHLQNIGRFYLMLKNYLLAIKYLKEAFYIFNFVMCSNHCLTQSTKMYLEEAFSNLKNNSDTMIVEKFNKIKIETIEESGKIKQTSKKNKKVKLKYEVFAESFDREQKRLNCKNETKLDENFSEKKKNKSDFNTQCKKQKETNEYGSSQSLKSNSSTGVKKKAALKKICPRSKTPLPPTNLTNFTPNLVIF